jgi:hypothetical protein
MPHACGPLLAGFYEAGATISQGCEALEAAVGESVAALPPETAAPAEPMEEARGEEVTTDFSVTEGAEKTPEEESPDAPESWPFEYR